ncbi:DUF6197 family protein [Parafrankia discariae]|uniref:DUF6197 family protein n=1 Tax=Parafrankia discariae TaxID=365528 RepID=UPI0003673121|nr:hypothetical protein [Parafrankia discariae]
MTTSTPTPAAALTDAQATTVLTLALHAPAGVTAPAAAAALGRGEAWIYRHLDAGIEAGTVTRLGPDRHAGAGRYQATRITVTASTLLAGALLALTERGWTAADYEDETGRVDLIGALRLATGTHPYELPDNPMTLVALYDAEDTLAAGLGADPTQVDSGTVLLLWQSVDVDATTVTTLVLTALGLPR